MKRHGGVKCETKDDIKWTYLGLGRSSSAKEKEGVDIERKVESNKST